MLDPEYLRRLTEGSEQIASLLHTELVKIIVQAIVTRMERGDSYRLTARDRWMLEVLQAAGYLRQDLEREIAAKTKLMLQEMKEAFEDAGVRSLAWDDAVYIAAGLEPTPLRQSPQLIRLLERGYEKTAGEWVNFTGTTADAAQQLFIRECDKAYSLVASGGMSHAQAVRQAVETVAREGVRVTYPTGHTDTVETAVARAVRTGVGQACGEMSMARMREMGWKIVLVSAHLGARTGDGGENHTNHFWWQGKFYRLDDEDGSGPEDAAQPQQEEAEHPKIAAEPSGPAPAPKRIEPEDVTEEYLRTATPGQGKITYDEGYEEKQHQTEIDFAEWIQESFGGDIRLLKEVDKPGVYTPDYEWNGKLWDLKVASTEKAADAAIRHGLRQIAANPGGVILDYRGRPIDGAALLAVINARMRHMSAGTVDILTVFASGIKVYRYKK